MPRNFLTDGEDGAAPTAAGPSRVFPFRRTTAATSGPAAGDDPSSSPAIPLGELVNAVVLRLANKRVRLKVVRASDWEEDDGGSR
ncbi:hypothetical protein GOB78_07685 [Sinorhizobium meliloti]|nr:hypothetical protein [Sinorhizobium meliloti]